MKNKIVVFLFSSLLFGQEKATSLFNVNVSFIGVGAQYEQRLNDNFTAVAGLDYTGGFSYTSDRNNESNFNYIFTTSLNVEGRYYYNFDRRITKGRNTNNNSANYLALKVNYIPNLLTTSSDNKEVNSQGNFTLNYGLKRSFSKNFFYEFYTGLGIALYKEINEYYRRDYEWEARKEAKTNVAFDLGFKVGYNF